MSTRRVPWWEGNPRLEDVACEGSIFLNQGRRAVRCHGFLGARLRSGSLRPQEQRGVGDGILLDFKKGFFAVSDSSDRDPSFSRKFLLRFSEALDRLDGVGSGRVFSAAGLAALKAELETRSATVLCEMSSTESCTLTGVLILPTEAGRQGLVLHTGDSLLLKCDLGARETQRITENNFWMVGRTRRFFQVEYVFLMERTRLLLATDGFSGLQAPESESGVAFVQRLFDEHPVEEVPDVLIDGYDLVERVRDDLALVSLDPSQIFFADRRIVLGGTTNDLERRFQDGLTSGQYRNSYEPMPRAGMSLL